MSGAKRREVAVRSYRSVLDGLERRIYRLDRWRLPTPHGVSVRSIVYVLAVLATVAVAGRLPVAGAGLSLVPDSLRWLGVPLTGGIALAAWAPDGRPPHAALRSLVRFWLWPRTLAGLRRCAPVGAELAALGRVQLAPSGDEPRYRRGRVRGPARVVLRYPARVERRGSRLSLRSAGPGRALSRGVELRLGAGGELRVE